MPDETPKERDKRLREEFDYLIVELDKEGKYTLNGQTTKRYKRLSLRLQEVRYLLNQQ